MQPASVKDKPQEILYLPDTLLTWPYPRVINPYYKEVEVESAAWIDTFMHHIKDPRVHDTIKKTDSGTFAFIFFISPLPESTL
jgi:hypothetical protein